MGVWIVDYVGGKGREGKRNGMSMGWERKTEKEKENKMLG